MEGKTVFFLIALILISSTLTTNIRKTKINSKLITQQNGAEYITPQLHETFLSDKDNILKADQQLSVSGGLKQLNTSTNLRFYFFLLKQFPEQQYGTPQNFATSVKEIISREKNINPDDVVVLIIDFSKEEVYIFTGGAAKKIFDADFITELNSIVDTPFFTKNYYELTYDTFKLVNIRINGLQQQVKSGEQGWVIIVAIVFSILGAISILISLFCLRGKCLPCADCFECFFTL